MRISDWSSDVCSSDLGIAGKRTGGFETAAQQIEFLDGMDREEQLQFIDEALVQSASDDLQTLHAYWRAGDAEAIWDEMGADMRDRYPKLYRHHNVASNDDWVQQTGQKGVVEGKRVCERVEIGGGR